jgi:hypothetical protein
MGRGRYVDLVSYDVKLKVSNGRTSQKWYFDNKTKTIRSRQTTSYSLQIQSSGNSKNVVITSTSSRWWQLWSLDGDQIRNVYTGQVLDVKDGKDEEGNNIEVSDFKNSTSQSWSILYADKRPADRTSGYNRYYNMKIGDKDPFFLQSRLPMKRVLSTPNASSVRINTLHEQRTDKKQ